MWADPLAPQLSASEALLHIETSRQGAASDASKRERRLTVAAIFLMSLLALGRETCWVETLLGLDWQSAIECRSARWHSFGPDCPREVWVIRHGEKSSNPEPGSSEELGLNATGLARAQHLAMLVEAGRWPRFSAVYASSPQPVLREKQTVEPLAAAIGVPVNDSFAQRDGEVRARLAGARVSNCTGHPLA